MRGDDIRRERRMKEKNLKQDRRKGKFAEEFLTNYFGNEYSNFYEYENTINKKNREDSEYNQDQ